MLKSGPAVAPSLSDYFFSPSHSDLDPSPSAEQPIEPKENTVTQESPDDSHRTESISLVMSKKLSEDIRILTKLLNPKNSINDTIIQILENFTQTNENQTKILMFKQLMDEINRI